MDIHIFIPIFFQKRYHDSTNYSGISFKVCLPLYFLGACNWSSWTECSKTCDIGSQERSRAENCNGDSKETKSCGKPDWCLLETLKKIFW